jgi:deoxycytidylate deaminase
MSLKIATKQAAKSKFHYQIGACIVKSGRVLASASNAKRYNRLTGRPWTSIHAEEQAILTVLKRFDGLRQLAGATIYVSRVTPSGKTQLAKPCPHCQALIDSVGIKTVVHT